MLKNVTAALNRCLLTRLSTCAHTDLNNDISAYYNNHVAAITGAGSGIGRALACHLASMGCHLALADINAEQLAQTQALLAGYDIKMTTTVLDVADQAAVAKWAQNVVSNHSKANFIFNNAGVAMYSTVEGCSIKELEWLMNINFWGVVYGTKAFLPLIKNSVKRSQDNTADYATQQKSRENGHIINISSVFGMMAQPSQSAYNASKFAVRGFTESLRQELDIECCGVSATCVHPGGIKTNIANNARGNDSLSALGMRSDSQAIESFNKFLRLAAKAAAWVILQAVATNQKRCLIGDDAKLLDIVQRVFPAQYSTVLYRLSKLSRALKITHYPDIDSFKL